MKLELLTLEEKKEFDNYLKVNFIQDSYCLDGIEAYLTKRIYELLLYKEVQLQMLSSFPLTGSLYEQLKNDYEYIKRVVREMIKKRFALSKMDDIYVFEQIKKTMRVDSKYYENMIPSIEYQSIFAYCVVEDLGRQDYVKCVEEYGVYLKSHEATVHDSYKMILGKKERKRCI